MRRGVVAGVVLVAVMGAVAGGTFLFGEHAVPGGSAVVEIPPGSGTEAAASLLAEAGVVRSALAFRLLALVSGTSRRLQAGEYRFQGSMTPGEVLRRVVAGDVLLHQVTLPEGLTLAETITLLAASDLKVTGDLAAAARQREAIADLDPEAADLEGYLFPDTYSFPRKVSAGVVIRRLVARFRAVAGSLEAEMGSPPDGVRSWVTLASLVEKESAREGERARIAGVFVNRLRIGMPLQCDPTVVYALKQAGIEMEGPLARYLDVDQPYNTYRHPGLPPGPIANPGRSALAAALRPAATDELYFVADGRGGHRFSRSLKEHNLAVREWRQETKEAARP
jgi:UPF0755 protein